VSRSVFLDTSAWFAALSPRDQWHERGLKAYTEAVRTGHLFVTTTLVIAEVHALLLRWRDVDTGARFHDAAFKTASHVVIAPDTDLVVEATTRWIRRYADQSFTLCDDVSFEVMRRERVTRALAYDAHFETAGFELAG